MTTTPADDKRSSDKRERILAAARAVFSEKGYEKASVSEIVRHAGVAQGTFYLYFDSKADLPQAFADELRHLLFKHAARALGDTKEGRNFSDTVEAMLYAVYRTAKSFGPIFDIIASETSAISESTAGTNESYRADTFHPLMKSFLEHHQERGLLDSSIDLTITVRLIDGVMTRVAYDLLLSKADFNRDHYIKQAAAFLCRAMGAG